MCASTEYNGMCVCVCVTVTVCACSYIQSETLAQMHTNAWELLLCLKDGEPLDREV